MVSIGAVQRELLAEDFWLRQLLALQANMFPAEHVMLGEEASSALRVVLGRARAQGFQDWDEVRRWAILSHMLGTYFDQDPLLPWAAAALSFNNSQNARMSALFEEGLSHVARVGGAQGRHYRAALGRALRMPYATLVEGAQDHLRGCIDAGLGSIHPRGFAALGSVGRTNLVGGARRVCVDAGFECAELTVVLSLLHLLLGSNIHRDPLHPWVGEALSKPGVPLSQRAPFVHERAVCTLRKFVALDPRLQGGN